MEHAKFNINTVKMKNKSYQSEALADAVKNAKRAVEAISVQVTETLYMRITAGFYVRKIMSPVWYVIERLYSEGDKYYIIATRVSVAHTSGDINKGDVLFFQNNYPRVDSDSEFPLFRKFQSGMEFHKINSPKEMISVFVTKLGDRILRTQNRVNIEDALNDDISMPCSQEEFEEVYNAAIEKITTAKNKKDDKS